MSQETGIVVHNPLTLVVRYWLALDNARVEQVRNMGLCSAILIGCQL
jgi:hypothetical protein